MRSFGHLRMRGPGARFLSRTQDVDHLRRNGLLHNALVQKAQSSSQLPLPKPRGQDPGAASFLFPGVHDVLEVVR